MVVSLLDAFSKNYAIGQTGERIVARHIGDPCFGLAPLCHVLIGRNPAAVGCLAVHGRDDAVPVQFQEVRSRRKLTDELLLIGEQFCRRPPRVISSRNTEVENVPECDPGLQLLSRQPEDFTEPPVHDLKSILRIIQTETLRHVIERGVEPQIRSL